MSNNITQVECIFCDDGARPRGIPSIHYSFNIRKGEDLDKRMEEIRLDLEAKIKQLGF